MEVRVNLGETGMGRVFVATHSCSVQSEMLNEAHAKNKKKQKKQKKQKNKNVYTYIYIYIFILRDIHRYQGKQG